MTPEMHEHLRKQHDSTYFEVIYSNQYKISRKDIEGFNVIDIGANNGTFSVLANDYGANKIVAIEPNPISYKLMAENVKGMNVISVNCAVWSGFGKVSVDKTPEYCEHDGRHYVVFNEHADIDAIPFKEILHHFDDKPIVLKIDCEGSEYKILYSADIKDLKRCSTILIEMHENFGAVKGEFGCMRKLADYLIGIGYECEWSNIVVPYIASLFRFNLKTKKEYLSIEDASIQVRDINPVTVVISEFIRPELLVEQINALQNQSFKPEEIIVWQTQLENNSEAYEFVNNYPNVNIIKTIHDFGLNSRFTIPLLAKTPWVCLLDDDVFPAPCWLDECYKISRKYNAVICPYGWNYTSDYSDLTSKRYGDNGEHNEEPQLVQIGGHGWFGQKEWFTLFHKESPVSKTHADDIHFAYSLKKAGIPIFVSPYPENDKSVWGNTRSEAGLGFKALHARKFEDKHIWGDLNNKSNTDGTGYLAGNLKEFCDKRDVIIRMYLSMYPDFLK